MKTTWLYSAMTTKSFLLRRCEEGNSIEYGEHTIVSQIPLGESVTSRIVLFLPPATRGIRERVVTDSSLGIW